MNCALTQLLIVQQSTASIDLSSRQVLNKISSLMLSQIIQSVKQTKNSYGDQVHLPSIMLLEASKIDNLEAAPLLLYVIGTLLIFNLSLVGYMSNIKCLPLRK